MDFRKIVVFPLICLCFSVAFSDIAAAQTGSASGKVKIEAKKTDDAHKESVEQTTQPAPPGDSAPYTFTRGKRDPFVPFGGNVAPASTDKKSANVSKQVAQPKPGDKKATAANATQKQEVTSLPVKVTGTMMSSGTSYAILTAEGGGASFMVKPGDTIGEYTVKSVNANEVVLLWQGRPYTLTVQTSLSAPGGRTKSPAGVPPGKATLPAPVVKEDKSPAPPAATPTPTATADEGQKKTEDKAK
jgi:Tfp pilus assembly protein PilP